MSTQAVRRYRYYDLLLVAFVTVLLCSNLIGAGKAAVITLPVLGEVTYGAGILFFLFPTCSATYLLKSMVTPMIDVQCGQDSPHWLLLQ